MECPKNDVLRTKIMSAFNEWCLLSVRLAPVPTWVHLDAFEFV